MSEFESKVINTWTTSESVRLSAAGPRDERCADTEDDPDGGEFWLLVEGPKSGHFLRVAGCVFLFGLIWLG